VSLQDSRAAVALAPRLLCPLIYACSPRKDSRPPARKAACFQWPRRHYRPDEAAFFPLPPPSNAPSSGPSNEKQRVGTERKSGGRAVALERKNTCCRRLPPIGSQYPKRFRAEPAFSRRAMPFPRNPRQDEEALRFPLSLTCLERPCRASDSRSRPSAAKRWCGRTSLYRMALVRFASLYAGKACYSLKGITLAAVKDQSTMPTGMTMPEIWGRICGSSASRQGTRLNPSPSSIIAKRPLDGRSRCKRSRPGGPRRWRLLRSGELGLALPPPAHQFDTTRSERRSAWLQDCRHDVPAPTTSAMTVDRSRKSPWPALSLQPRLEAEGRDPGASHRRPDRRSVGRIDRSGALPARLP
jgi:hypothetical protein